jgi:hypothetical protein
VSPVRYRLGFYIPEDDILQVFGLVMVQRIFVLLKPFGSCCKIFPSLWSCRAVAVHRCLPREACGREQMEEVTGAAGGCTLAATILTPCLCFRLGTISWWEHHFIVLKRATDDANKMK